MLLLTGCSLKTFVPQDVSDETIESIQTYDDYLVMYEMITQDYLDNYEEAIKKTSFYSEESFTKMKDQYAESFKKQRELYGEIGEKNIVGKEWLVEFLISYRDSLKEFTDEITESFEWRIQFISRCLDIVNLIALLSFEGLQYTEICNFGVEHFKSCAF